MAGKKRLEIVQDSNKQKHIRIVASNNRIVATTEQHKTAQGINNAVKALKKIVPNAQVVDKTIKTKKK